MYLYIFALVGEEMKGKVLDLLNLTNGLLLIYRLCGALLISQKGKFMAKYDISFSFRAVD